MNVMKYTVYGGTAYLTELSCEGGNSLRIELRGTECGTVRIGKMLAKISHGVADIHLRELGDGLFAPELITAAGRIRLDTLSLRGGRVSLAAPNEIHTRLAVEVLTLRCKLDGLEPQIKRLTDAVFGATIF